MLRVHFEWHAERQFCQANGLAYGYGWCVAQSNGARAACGVGSRERPRNGHCSAIGHCGVRDSGCSTTTSRKSEAEVEAIRRSVRRGQPYGYEAWVRQTAEQLGLELTLRARGRLRLNALPSDDI